MVNPRSGIRSRRAGLAAVTLLVLGIGTAQAQQRPDPAALMKAQREAMAAFAFMDGAWRGPAVTVRPDGTRHDITQTERIGSLLDGTVKVLEGRGYEADGRTTFNALGLISYNPGTRTYAMHSHAMGFVGDFIVKRTDDGFTWDIPAGPATIRYNAVVKDGIWTEVGDRLVPGKDPERIFEMRLTRIGDSDWPGAGAIPPK